MVMVEVVRWLLDIAEAEDMMFVKDPDGTIPLDWAIIAPRTQRQNDNEHEYLLLTGFSIIRASLSYYLFTREATQWSTIESMLAF